MTVVCATDFSERAAAAVDAAAAVCARFERLSPRELRIVHVLEPGSALLAEQQKELEAAANRKLEAIAARARERTGAPVHTQLLSGSASEALCEYAARIKARLLVVASQGHSDSPLYRIGGTSERITKAAPVPVLVVRSAAPFIAWSNDERPLRILLGTDMTPSSEPATRFICELRAAGPCDVIVGYVHDRAEAMLRYGLRRRPLLEPDEEIEQLVLRDLRGHFGELAGTGKLAFRTTLGVGRKGDHLLELAEAEGADLIAVGCQQKRGLSRLSSVSSVALHFGHTAVACIPAAEGSPRAPLVIPRVTRVLVATDLTESASRATAYAYALLEGRGGEVHLLHVAAAQAGQHRGEDSEEHAAWVSALRALVPEQAGRDGVVTRTHVAYAEDVARAICEHAERLGADVVCMASSGRSGLRRAMLGSVADAVVHASQRPVLMVKIP